MSLLYMVSASCGSIYSEVENKSLTATLKYAPLHNNGIVFIAISLVGLISKNALFRGCCTNNNLYSVRFCCLAFPGGVLGAG